MTGDKPTTGPFLLPGWMISTLITGTHTRPLLPGLVVAMLLAGSAATALGGDALAVRFCENRPDGVVLELVRVPRGAEPPERHVHVAVPADVRCTLTSPTGGLVRVADQAVLRDLRIVSLAVEALRLEAFEQLQKETGLTTGTQEPVPFRLAFTPPTAGSKTGRPKSQIEGARPPIQNPKSKIQNPAGSAPSRPPSPYMEPVLESLVVNWPIPASYRGSDGVSVVPEPATRPVPEGFDRALKIEVEPPGRVRVGLSEIAAHAGGRWSADRARRRLGLWHEGKPHPFRIDPGSDGAAGDLCFNAAPFESPYTPWDVYFLTWDSLKGNGRQAAGARGRKLLQVQKPRERERAREPEPELSQGSGFKVQGSGFSETQEVTPDVERSIHVGTRNERKREDQRDLKVEERGTTTHSLTPEAAPVRRSRLRIARLAPDLRAPEEGADLIYVCHPAFVKEIGPLARWRRRQGMRVAVVTTDRIADQFNYGRDEPEAIRRFLAWAYCHWPPPAPAFVVLVGDASARPKSNDPAVSRNFISTIYGERTDPPAYDDGYVAILGDGRLPQMMLGRLSVNEPGQLTAIVEKLIAHERRSEPGRWRGQLLLLADNGYERLFDPSITSAIPEHLDVPRLDVRDFPYVDHYNLPRTKISPACREATVRRLNQGAAAVHYVGHGGVSLISHEKMFFWTDVARLSNRARLPFFVQVSCRTGGFDWPEQQWQACLSELLLRRPHAGALGVLAASRALYGDEGYLQRVLFRSYQGGRAIRLGEIKLLMKVQYLLNRRDTEFIHSYNLLGDPASRLMLPMPFERFDVEPDRIELDPEKAPSVRVRGVLPDRRDAAIDLAWRDPAGQLIEMKRELKAPDGAFDAIVKLPTDPAPGTWRLIAYAVAGRRQPADFQGVGRIEVVAPPPGFPSDPDGEPDLAFVGDTFAFVDEELTDGDTIRIRTAIENRGTRRSAPTRLVWEYRPPGEDPTTSRVANVIVPALYPAERWPATLRWDPFDVAGALECIVHIVPAGLEQQTRNNRVSRELYIKTKPDLTLAGPPKWSWEERRLRLTLAVANRGETPAERVQIACSLGDQHGPRLPLAEPQLVAERLEGNSQTPARQWAVDVPDLPAPLDYLYIEIGTAEPVAEIDKKNNRFRVRVRLVVPPSGGSEKPR